MVLLLLTFPTLAFASYCVPGMTPAQPQGPDPTPPVCGPGSNSAAQPGGCGDCDICSKSPGYLASGTYVSDFGDTQIPTAGMYPLIVTRRYDSGRPTDGPLGAGWSMNLTAHLYYATYLLSAPNTYTYEADIVMPSGLLYRFTASGNTFTAPAGSFDTLVRNGDGTYSFSMQHTRSVYRFNADGSLASLTDDYGNSITYAYDSSGRLHEVADAAGSGRFIDVTWGADGRIAQLTDNAGRIWKYFYENGDGTLTSYSDPLVSSDSSQRTTYYTYVQGRFGPVLAGIQDRWHRTVTALAWYADGRLKSYTEGDYNDSNPSASSGEKYTYVYSGSSVTKSDSFGSKTYVWNGQGVTNDPTHVFDTTTGLLLQDYANNTSYSYDARGNVAGIAFGGYSGASWSYTYDTNYPDFVSKITPSQPTQWPGWKFRYNSPSETPPGALAEVDRINNDGVTSTAVATYIYDAKGHLAIATDANGVITFYGYNAKGDLTSVRIGSNTTTYDYDSLGRVTTVTPPNGKATVYAYDAASRLTSVTLPPLSGNPTLDFTTHVAYDQFDATTGLVSIVTTDPNGTVTSQAYDALGHMIQTTDGLGNATLYAYQHNLLHTLTDANGNASTYQYDSSRRLTTTVYPDGASETYNYSPATGQISSIVDRRGNTKAFSYDAFGREAAVTFSGPSGSQSVTYGYSGHNLTGVTDTRANPALTMTYTYDAQWRLATETQIGGDKLTYTYAGNGNLLGSYRLDPPSGQPGTPVTAAMTYDNIGRLSTLQWSPISGTFTYTYTPDSRYAAIQFPNGQGRTFAYDEQDRLTTLTNTDIHARSYLSYSYGYDYDWNRQSYTSLGNRTSVTVSGSSAFITNGTAKYVFDANQQLTSTTRVDGSYVTYDYDAIGNRTRVGGPNGVTYYRYAYFQNSNNKNTQRLQSAIGPVFAYDANGNVITEGGSSYTWDVSNRLVGIGGAQYLYDYVNRLYRFAPSGGGSPVRNISVGHRTIAERSADTTRTNDYLLGPGLDEPLAKQASDGTISYYAIDGLGSVVATTNTATQISRSAAFDEWGAPISGSADFFGYAGALIARQANFGWNLRNRYYRPSLGRFMNEDPLEQHLRVASLQAYVYTGNNPIIFTDPYGLFCTKFLSHGPKQVYFNSLPQWTGWHLGTSFDPPHEPEPGVPYNATSDSMAQSGGYAVGAPIEPGGEYGFWPIYGDYCVWHNELISTKYWKRKITIYNFCTCPFKVWTSDGGYDFGHQLQVIAEKHVLTQGASFLDIPGLKIECGEPPE